MISMSSSRIVRVIAVALMVSFLVGASVASLPAASAQDLSSLATEGGVYNYLTEGTGSEESPYKATITGYQEGNEAYLAIQSGLEGYPVKAIAANAFQNCTSLEAVVIPERIETIGDRAFAGCSSLQAAYFAGELPQLGADVFAGCAPGFTIYYLQDSWSNYDTYPTAPWSLGTYTDAAGGSYYYYVINNEITIFKYLSGRQLAIPAAIDGQPVVSIGTEAFYQCAVETVSIAEGVERIADRAFSWEHLPNSPLKSVSLPRTLTAIGDEAFRYSAALTNIDFPAALKYIGFEAFRECGLTSVTLPNDIAYVGGGAFYYCPQLKAADLGRGLSAIPERMFGWCQSFSNIIIPGRVIAIGDSAFYNCDLRSLDLNNVETIGLKAFYGNANLQKVIMEDVRIVGNEAFSECSSLRYVEFDDLESIAPGAFLKCTALEYVVLPDHLRTIGKDAFRGCTSLSAAYFEGDQPVIGDNAFYKTDADFQVYYLPEHQASWSSYDATSIQTWNGIVPQERAIWESFMFILVAIILIALVVVVLMILIMRKKGRAP